MTEALVAIATLVIGVFVLSSIFNNAVSATTVSRNYLLAQNLLIEGMEVVKNVRDTNLLIRPDRQDCWLVREPKKLLDIESGGTCPNTVGAKENYVIVVDNGTWKLDYIGGTGDALDMGNPAANNEKYLLYEVCPGDDKVCQLVQSDEAHDGASDTPPKYYRSIEFLDVAAKSARFKVTLQWADGALVRTLNEEFTIYNF